MSVTAKTALSREHQIPMIIVVNLADECETLKFQKDIGKASKLNGYPNKREWARFARSLRFDRGRKNLFARTRIG